MKNELLSENQNDQDVNNSTEYSKSDLCSQSDQRQLTNEDIRLGGQPPLKTICILSSGPLLSQIASALYGVINTIWISKSLGDSGLTAISTYQNFETIGRSFAFFFQTSTSTKIASLFGEGKNSEASQVLTDLLRFSFICSIISPAIFIPLSKVCVKWFGADEFITNLGFKYIVPNLCLSIVSCFFYTFCGCLQAEGRSWLFSSVQIIALCLDMFVFCPLFLLCFRIGISGAALANGISELIPCLIILILYYKGKFGIKPDIKQLCNKFSSHSFEALKLGFAQLIFQLSNSVPGIIVRKFFGLSCGNDQETFNHVMAAFNTFNRLWIIEGAVPNAINLGFIPAAAYAYGAKRYIRIIWLFIHALWISFIWCSLTMICAIAIPVPIAKIFSKTPEYLEWSKIILRNGNILTCICEAPGLITSLHQAMKKGTQASILSFFVQLFPVPVASVVLYYTNKNNIGRLVYCYPFQALFGVIFAIPFFIVALKEIITKHMKKRTSSLFADDEIESISLSNKNEKKKKKGKNDDDNSSFSSIFSSLIELSD